MLGRMQKKVASRHHPRTLRPLPVSPRCSDAFSIPQHREVWENHNKRKSVMSISHMSLICPQRILYVPSNFEGRLTDLSCSFLFMQIISTVTSFFVFLGASFIIWSTISFTASFTWKVQPNMVKSNISKWNLNPVLPFFEDTIYASFINENDFLWDWRLGPKPKMMFKALTCLDGEWTSGNLCKHIPRYWLNTFLNHTFYKPIH